MVEAPKRIWVYFEWDMKAGMATDKRVDDANDVEYIRADLIPVEQLKRMRHEMLEQGIPGWPNTIAYILAARGENDG